MPLTAKFKASEQQGTAGLRPVGFADKPVRELKRKIRALTHRQSQVDLGAALTRSSCYLR